MQIREPVPRAIINAAKTAAVLLGIAGIWLFWGELARSLLAIVFGAAVFAFLLAPLCGLIEKKLPRQASVLIALAGSLLVLTGLGAALLPLFIRQLSSLSELLPDAFMRLHTLAANLLSRLQSRLPGISLPELDFSGMQGGISEAARNALSTVSTAAGSAYRLFLMGALSYFLLVDRDNILLRMELLVPSSCRRLAVRAGGALMRELRLYIRGQMTIALAVGVLACAGLVLLGIRNAPLLAVFVGIFNLVPYFGPLLGGIPAAVTALSISWQKAMYVVILLFLVQQIDGMVISPRVMGNITGFSPAVVLLAIFIGANTGGIGGMLFALPALMTIRTLYRVFVQRHEKN